MRDTSTAARVERSARHSTWLVGATRLGLVGYGVMHLLVAWVAIRLVLQHSGGRATGAGALATLTQDAWGRATLVALAAGFAALAVWQALTAAVGFRRQSGWERTINRLGAASRVCAYGYFLVASVRLLITAQGGTSASSPRQTASTVLSHPFGAFLLLAASIVVAGVGVGLAWFGLATEFADQLDTTSLPGPARRTVLAIGRVGYGLKGAALVLIGVMLAWAAVTRDVRSTGGLDVVLERLLGHTLGPPAVVAAGAGIGCFGLYLWARAAFLDRRTLTS